MDVPRLEMLRRLRWDMEWLIQQMLLNPRIAEAAKEKS